MQKTFLLLAALAASYTGLAQTDAAATDTSNRHRSLDEVEVTATSNPKKSLLYQPVSIVKLNKVELKRSTGLFLDDAINANIPGVYMERRSVSGGQQFNIRGYGSGAWGTRGINSNFDGQGYKVYLNGIPLTDAEGITVMDDIDFGSVGNVEVVKGPSGTLYGMAISGVVNLTTLKPENGTTSISQQAMVGSYGLQRYTTTLQIGGERSSLLVNYGKQMYDGFMPHTSSHKDFVNVFGEFRPNERQTINAYVGYSNSYDQRNGELTIGQYDTLDYSGNPRYIANDAHSALISFRAGLSHRYEFNKSISNTTTVFGTGISSNSSSAGGWTDKTPLNYGLRSTVDMKFALNEKFGLSGIAGVEAQKQNAQTIGFTMIKDSTNPGPYNIIGATRSNQYTVSSTWSAFTEWTLSMPYDLSFTAGVGLSKMNIELNDRLAGIGANSQYKATYSDMVSPHFALNKVFSKNISAYVSYSQAYKAPVSSYFFIPVTGEVLTGLKPEKGTQIEIGTKGSLLHDRLVYQLAAYNAVFSNKITAVAVPDTTGTATAYSYMVNGGEVNNKGIEALIKYTAYQSATGFFSSVNPFVNLAVTDATYNDFKFETLTNKKNSGKKNDSVAVSDYSNKVVAGVPPLTFNVGVDFATRPGLYGNVVYSYRDAMYFTSDNLNETDAYGLLNAKLGYRKALGGHFDLDAFVGANNITGTQYYYMVFLNQLPDAYLPAPNEINFFGGLTLKYNF